MFCPNPDCPHARRVGDPAAYREGITECQECGSPLVETPPEPGPVSYEKFEPVFEIGNAALVPLVDSLLQTAGMRFFFKGIGTGIDFIAGPAKVYVEADRAEEARELLADVSAASEEDGLSLVENETDEGEDSSE
jgi:hypothetical protein